VAYDINGAADLATMIANATVIVIGSYEGFASSWNMARDPSDVRREDSENIVTGFLYHFLVEEVIKGSVTEDRILVNHRFSEEMTITESNSRVSSSGVVIREANFSNTLTFTLNDPLFIEPVVAERHILFIRPAPILGNFFASVEPFQLRINQDESVTLLSNLLSAGSFEQVVSIDDTRSFVVSISLGGEPMVDMISGMSLSDIRQIIRGETP
jgi:hypothetical protein